MIDTGQQLNKKLLKLIQYYKHIQVSKMQLILYQTFNKSSGSSQTEFGSTSSQYPKSIFLT